MITNATLVHIKKFSLHITTTFALFLFSSQPGHSTDQELGYLDMMKKSFKGTSGLFLILKADNGKIISLYDPSQSDESRSKLVKDLGISFTENTHSIGGTPILPDRKIVFRKTGRTITFDDNKSYQIGKVLFPEESKAPTPLSKEIKEEIERVKKELIKIEQFEEIERLQEALRIKEEKRQRDLIKEQQEREIASMKKQLEQKRQHDLNKEQQLEEIERLKKELIKKQEREIASMKKQLEQKRQHDLNKEQQLEEIKRLQEALRIKEEKRQKEILKKDDKIKDNAWGERK